jgi:acyl-coenzyme A synthetase/AMP-(fatty) acid ligase
MLRAASRVVRSLTVSPALRQQVRLLSDEVKQNHREVGQIYHELLEQSSSPQPIACNFVSQVVDQWAIDPNRLAIRSIHQETGQREEITYADIATRSRQIAHFLQRQNIQKGDAIALMLGQRPAWWFSLAGLMRAGVAAVPCPRLLTSKDLLYRINDLNIRGIITAPELQDRVNAIKGECPTLKTLITTGPGNQNWLSLANVFASEEKGPYKVVTTTEDPCIYLYTSGTTGQPKAVQHNSDYPFFHWPTGRRWLRATVNDLIYNASDTGWGFTVWITTAAWAMGSKLLITPTDKKFKPQQMLSILRDEGVTIFCAAPTVLRLLVAQPDFDKYDFPSLKRIVTVGEALDETVIERFAARGVEVAVGFGQAETPLLMGRVDDQPHVPRTMGKPIDPYKVVALDDEFRPLPPGNIGQIAVDLVEGKRAGIMRQYANAPEKTQKTRSPDGRYYLTGDWAEYRADGLFAYQGRRDDLIKSRGYRIGPDEVEKAGMSHPAVAKIAVVGIRENRDSPAITVKAFILLKPAYTETPELIHEIQEHIKKETGPYKYPRLVECLKLEEWEKYETTSGKIRRAGLREREDKKFKELQSHEVRVAPKF